MLFHPYFLKEYNNRWFVVGTVGGNTHIATFALDRIVELEHDLEAVYPEHSFNADEYYRNTIGVTVLSDRDLFEVRVWIDGGNAPYVLTKPFHHSQQLVKQYEDGSIVVKMIVHINYELLRLLLGFGSSLRVIKPRKLREQMKHILVEALERYERNGEGFVSEDD